MSTLDLIGRLGARASERPDAPAVVEPHGRTLSRRALVRQATRVASGLRAAGLSPGDHVLFAVRPGADAVALMTGIAEAGGVMIAAQFGVGDTLFAEQMRLAAPRWVVGESWLLAAMRSRVARWLVRRRGGTLPSAAPLRDTRMVRVGPWLPGLGGTLAIADVMALGAEGCLPDESSLPDEASADGEAAIVFTSGTTGAPKAVVHTRRSLRATMDVVGGQLDIGDGDVLYARDLHLILPALLAGATAVVSRAFDAERALEALDAHGVTHLFEVTANCERLADFALQRGRTLPPTVRHALVGAAPVRGAFLERFQRVLPPGARAWCVYGATEILPIAAVALDEKIAYRGDGDLVGEMVPGVTARTGDAGELVVAGPHLCAGYLGAPPLGPEHATGDAARVDGRRIVLLGRIKDMIIRREHNVYPGLHEPVIERIPGVRRCAMVGVWDDARADERIVLFVEPSDLSEPADDADGRALVRRVERALRQGPCRIDEAALPDLVVAATLPEGGRSSKVDKARLRELARERLFGPERLTTTTEATCASP